MLHPSYSDLMKVVNSDVVQGEAPVVSSRYSIVMATSRRARQIIGGEDALVDSRDKKPLSVAVEELYESKVKILSEDDSDEDAGLPEGEESGTWAKEQEAPEESPALDDPESYADGQQPEE